MKYTISGEYPAYDIIAEDEEEGLVEEDHASDFATVMRWLVPRMERGDTVVWV